MIRSFLYISAFVAIKRSLTASLFTRNDPQISCQFCATNTFMCLLLTGYNRSTGG